MIGTVSQWDTRQPWEDVPPSPLTILTPDFFLRNILEKYKKISCCHKTLVDQLASIYLGPSKARMSVNRSDFFAPPPIFLLFYGLHVLSRSPHSSKCISLHRDQTMLPKWPSRALTSFARQSFASKPHSSSLLDAQWNMCHTQRNERKMMTIVNSEH